MRSHPKTLISTACRDGPLYDYWGSNTSTSGKAKDWRE